MWNFGCELVQGERRRDRIFFSVMPEVGHGPDKSFPSRSSHIDGEIGCQVPKQELDFFFRIGSVWFHTRMC